MQTKERMKAVTRKKREETAMYELPEGELKYKMTNDFMFKKVLQQHTKALEGLISAILGIQREQIKSIKVINPIVEGMTVNDKEVVLDLKLEMNDDSIINIEMQMENEGNII